MNNNHEACHIPNESMQLLAITSIPMQEANFACTYGSDEALIRGTVFPELYLPFLGERSPR